MPLAGAHPLQAEQGCGATRPKAIACHLMAINRLHDVDFTLGCRLEQPAAGAISKQGQQQEEPVGLS